MIRTVWRFCPTHEEFLYQCDDACAPLRDDLRAVNRQLTVLWSDRALRHKQPMAADQYRLGLETLSRTGRRAPS